MEWFNAILYISLLVWLHKHNKGKFPLFITAIWTLSSVLGIFYIKSDVYRDGVYEPSIIPFLYLFLMFVITLMPFIKEKYSITSITTSNTKIINYFCAFIAIVSIYPFLETVYQLVLSVINGKILLIGANYDAYVAGREDALIQFSRWGNRGITILQWLKVVTPLLFIFYIQQEKYNKLIASGVFVASLIPSLVNISIGSKTELIFFICYFFSLYMYLKNSFTDKTKKIYKKLIRYMTIITIFFVVTLAVGRYVVGTNYDNSNFYSFLFQYSSESIYNFNENAYHEKKHFGGQYAFYAAYHDFGLSDIDYDERREVFKGKMDGSPSLFYTYIGEMVLDFGLLGAALIVSIISFFAASVKRSQTISFDNLILIGLYIYIIANSLFYFCFKLGFYPVYCAVLCSIFFKIIKRKQIA